MFRYGKGRAWLIKKHPDIFSIVFLIPFLLAVFLILSIFVTAARIIWIYFPVIFIASLISAAGKRKIHLTLHLFLLYITTHISYGLGQIYGLFVNPKKPY